ncbi:hypothetical protein B566_EDAN013060, partial [Ephemera danica]
MTRTPMTRVSVLHETPNISETDQITMAISFTAKLGEFRWASTARAATFTDWHQGEPSNNVNERC